MSILFQSYLPLFNSFGEHKFILFLEKPRWTLPEFQQHPIVMAVSISLDIVRRRQYLSLSNIRELERLFLFQAFSFPYCEAINKRSGNVLRHYKLAVKGDFVIYYTYLQFSSIKERVFSIF